MTSHVLNLRRRLLALSLFALLTPLAHALSLDMSADPDSARPGDGVVVAITVTNDTNAPVSAVTLRMQMPPSGVDSISQSYGSSGATCPGGGCDPTEFVDWNLGTLAAGRGVQLTFPVVISSTTPAGTVIPFATRVLVGGVQQLTRTRSVTVSADNALVLNVDVDRNGALPGSALTYSLTYGNRNGTAVNGGALAMPLPPGATFVSATNGGALSGNTVLWSLGTLQGGQSGRQQVVVNVDGNLSSGTLLPVDAAAITATNGLGNVETARATLVSRVQIGAALGLAIAPNSDPARPDEAVRTAFTVTNPSAQPVFNAVLQVRMPTAGFESISQVYSSNGATCPGGGCDPYEFMTWNLGTLPPGGSTTVLTAATVIGNFASGRLIAFDAELRADGLPMVLGRHSIAVDRDNALTLALTSDKDPIAPGDTHTYDLTYGNRGPATITGATLALPLPAGVQFVSASGGGTLQGSTVRWVLPALLAGQSLRHQVVVNVAAGLVSGTPLTVDVALLEGNSATTGAEAARATLTTRVHTVPVLALATANNTDPARPNEAVRTAFTVSNRGSETPLFNTVLTVRVPTEGFDSISQTYFTGGGTCPGGGCDPYEFVNWNLGTLAPGGSITVSMVNRVRSGFESGRLTAFESQVSADGAPTVIGRRALAIDGDNALTLAVHPDRDSVAPGERITYVLDYANRSTGTINGSVLVFPVPAGATLVGASGGSLTARNVRFDLGSLLAGTGGRRTVTVSIPGSAPAGLALRVEAATLTGNSPITGAEVARATSNPRVVADNPLRLTLSGLTPNPVLANQALTATLRVTNAGGAPLNAVNVQARVPTEGVNSFSQSALSTDGACAGGGCDPYEFAVWSIASIAPGASVTLTMPMTVTSGFPTGRQIWLEALATDDNGDQSLVSGTALVGSQFSAAPPAVLFGDFDGNGVVSFPDLAIFNANFGTTNAAYDLDGNGAVNFADLAIFKTLFGRSLPLGTPAPGVRWASPPAPH